MKSSREHQDDCVFCQIYLKEKFKILDESENCILIMNRRKHGSKQHLLILSKSHIENVNSLDVSDLGMLKEMQQMAERATKKYGGGNPSRVGFHRPPFYSIKHLHCHVVIEPISSFYYNYISFWLNLKKLGTVIEELSNKKAKL